MIFGLCVNLIDIEKGVPKYLCTKIEKIVLTAAYRLFISQKKTPN